MKKVSKLNFSSKSITGFFVSHYSKFISGLFILSIIFGFYLVYQLLYPTIIKPEKINPQDIKTQQESINLNRYQTTSDELGNKGSLNNTMTPPAFLLDQ